jgi:hypothetical protein
MRDGSVTWNGERPRRLTALTLEAEGTAPLRWQGSATLDETLVTLQGESGPLAALAQATNGTGTAWPLRATLSALGASAGFDGKLVRGRSPQGQVTATIPDLAALAPLWPGLPPLRDLSLAASLTETGIGPLMLKAGAGSLDSLRPGLRLIGLTVDQPRADQPLVVHAEAALREVPLTLSGSLGAALLQASGAAPVALTVGLGAASATLNGTLGDQHRLADLDVALSAQVPALAVLAPLAGMPLPALSDLRVETRLLGQGPETVALQALMVRASAGDAAGDLVLTTGPRPALRGALTSRRISLDAFRAAPPPPPPVAPASPRTLAPVAGRPAGPPIGPPLLPPSTLNPADLPPIARPGGGRVIPDWPLPLHLFNSGDADLRWSVAELVSHEVVLQDANAHLVLQAGQATLDPLTASLGTASLGLGRFGLRANLDATATPPKLAFVARGDGLDLVALLAALGAPGGTAGRLELDTELRGQGEGLRGLAATASGIFGIAIQDGTVEAGAGSLLGRAVADLRRALPQLGHQAEGQIGLACGVGRWQLGNGIARTQALLLDGTLGRVGGTGSINLADETLGLRLLLDLRVPIGGALGGSLGNIFDGSETLRIRAPVPLTGSLARPRADYGPALTRGALSALGGGDTGEASASLLDCTQALAALHNGRGGAQAVLAPIAGPDSAPASPPPPAKPAPAPKPPKASQILRNLLGQPR